MARDTSKLSWQDWGHLLTVALIVAGVAGTLLLGAVLRAGPETTPVALAAVSSTPTSSAPWEARPPQTPAEVPPADEPPADPADAAPPADEPGPVPVPREHGEMAPSNGPTPGRPSAPAPETSALLPPPTDAPGSDWTLQFMVTCSDETAARIEQALGGDPRLQILPVRVDGRACRRICWGAYATREEALARAGLPAALIAVNREPIPRKVADLLR